MPHTTTTYTPLAIYKDNALEMVFTPEGYAEPTEEGFRYVYQYKDHLGNIRLSYSDTNGNGRIDTPIDTGVSLWEETFEDKSKANGDWDGSGNSWGWPITDIVSDKAHSGSKSGHISLDGLASGWQNRACHSNEWVEIDIDKPTLFRYSAWVYASTELYRTRMYLFMKTEGETDYYSEISEKYEMQKGEWVYTEKVVLVSPEIKKLNLRIDADGWGQYGGTAWYDNLKIEQLDKDQNEIVSETNYYPFGLAHKGYNEQVNSTNLGEHYKYNGKEEENELGLGWTDYGARRYMKDLGRWAGVDALAEKYETLSPFSYTANNPILYVDPDGKRIKIANNTSKALRNLAMIAATSRGRQRLNRLISSSYTYTARSTFWSSDSAYDGNGEIGAARTVYYVGSAWRPSVGGGVMSSMYAMGHELNHAYDHDVTNQAGSRMRKSRERSSVNFTNYLRSVHGNGSDMRKRYNGLGLKFSGNENIYNRQGENVTNFKQLDDLSSDSNAILGFSYNTSTESGNEQTEYIISATTSDGTYHYVRFDNKEDYQNRLDYIKEVQEKQKKKDEN